MVVDDSAVVRGFISRMVQGEPDMAVVAQASDGAMALDALTRHAVDVIVLDIEMPVMDGLTALPRLLALRPGVKVVIASTLSRRNAEISLKALSLGAADYLPKPEGAASLFSAEDFQRELVTKVRALGARRRPAAAMVAAPAAPTLAPRQPGAKVSAVAIGGSTGAPPMLQEIFRALKGRCAGVPIFVVQHMPPTFTALLAEQLGRAGERVVAEGRDGEPVVAGRAYVAPGGHHMTVEKTVGGPAVIRLNDGPLENFCRPAVDPLLRSLATAYGPGLLAVILSGLGADGALGCEAVARAGGRFAVQDEATSVIWGMPGAAHRTGLAESVLPLRDIAPYLSRAVDPPA